MKAYPRYKPSGADWLCDIPEIWGVKRVKFSFEIRKRIAGIDGITVLSITQKGIKIKDIESGKGQQAMDYSKYQLVEVGDFAMNHMDLLTGFIDISPFAGVTSPDYRVFSLTDAQSFARYYLYIFQLCYINKIFFGLGQGSSHLGRWRLPASQFNDFKIPVPSFTEQQAIADFLDRKTTQIDTLIAKKQRQIELLQEQRTALINQAVTKGLNPSAPMKDSGVEWLGEIPSHWEVAHLRWLAENVTTGKTPPTNQPEYYENANVNWFSPGDFGNQMVLKESKKKINQMAIEDGQAPLYKIDTVLLVGIGATLGKIGIIDNIGSSNQQINAISYGQQIYPPYGAYYLSSIKSFIVSQANFATLPILNQSQTKDIRHLIPSIEEQIEIVRYIQRKSEQIQQSIDMQTRLINYFQEYRTALISEAVTGKIDVRG